MELNKHEVALFAQALEHFISQIKMIGSLSPSSKAKELLKDAYNMQARIQKVQNQVRNQCPHQKCPYCGESEIAGGSHSTDTATIGWACGHVFSYPLEGNHAR